ncbi:MAG TPA: CHAT domain-containing protein [Allocoleopsis sp.]
MKLQEIQQQLDKDTVLLSDWVGDQESYLWVISSNSLTSYLLPNQAEIKKLAGGFLADTLDGDAALKKAKNKAIELTKIILKPAQSELQNKRLIIVHDGKLQYIPFNALASLNSTNIQDFKLLLFDHKIINLLSASTIEFIIKDTEKRKTAPKTVAVIADPVFGSDDDDRVKPVNLAQNNANLDTSNLGKIKRSLGKRAGLERLPVNRKEGENILSLVPEYQSKRLFDFEANLTNFNNYDLSQYRIIHLGNHGILNEEIISHRVIFSG